MPETVAVAEPAEEAVENNAVADDDWFIEISSYPTEGQILNPCIPYVGALSAPLSPGQMIVLDGEVQPGASRFDVNLLCKLSSRCDVALHVNPRFDERRVVRNSRLHGRWGDEEAVGHKFPLTRGEAFFLYIFVTEDRFMIAINGRHFCSYSHRTPLSRITGLHVTGDVHLFQLEHRREVGEYPLPGEAIAATSLAVPTLSCPANLNEFARHITGPEMPFLGDLPQGFEIGRQIDVIGRLKLLPQSFTVNLQKGKTSWPIPIIILHFNPRFKEGHIVVRNSMISGVWGTEERGGRCPFVPGHPFHLTIHCGETHYTISVDGEPYITYKHRVEPGAVDTIYIQGDIDVQDIYVR